MTGCVAEIRRHPIKAHGRERLARVTLAPGRTMPWDRTWAVAHEAARLTPGAPAWAPCANFCRGAKAPELQAINARLDTATATITLTHPKRPALAFRPDDPADTARFLAWVAPLCPPERAQPARLVKVPGRGMTDTAFPSISLINLASHRALEEQIGFTISPLRWRGNILVEGLAAWQEFSWVGHRLRIGGAELRVRERIGRCLATAANPETGQRDADTLGTLEKTWGHHQLGVYAEVTSGGEITEGDPIEVIG